MNETNTQTGFVDTALLERVKIGREYVAAKFGFRNHWYPVVFGEEIGEGQLKPVELLGEKILLKRIDGKVWGIRDRCLHRGVQLSKKPECYTKDTVTCWYHGFTYRFDTGLLCNIVGAPESRVIGKRKIQTYPIQEAKGLVFVFVGDVDRARELPELALDVPPGFLDDDLEVRGVHSVVNANWRIGCENGFDSTHIFIHKHAEMIKANSMALPLGLVPKSRNSFQAVEKDGAPKGVFDLFDPDHVTPVFEGAIGDQVVLRNNPDAEIKLPHHISIWLPCALRVQPWPHPSLTQYEWYVPINGERHIYLRVLGRKVSSKAETEQFEHEYNSRWRALSLEGFNMDDIWAREATEPFYHDDTGWLNEQLFEADGNIVEWRRLASKHNRGLQTPDHVR